ncbi:MAG: methenyltetrahydromethanopterin cyclohydrolase, partial [Methylobacterium mesophilicum]|nr:methenyltetrahydromethanopterin cyclohydrolase [Methylobacterium mesophilicum]
MASGSSPGAPPLPHRQNQPSVNRQAAPLVEALKRDAGLLHVTLCQTAQGTTFIDAGAACRGSLEAGRRIAAISMGGLGEVTLGPAPEGAAGWQVAVRSCWPALACLGSQYA